MRVAIESRYMSNMRSSFEATTCSTASAENDRSKRSTSSELSETPLFFAATSSFLRNGSRNRRSEEHTSELQSLMRISYAVFCLKKKKTNKTTHTPQTNK